MKKKISAAIVTALLLAGCTANKSAATTDYSNQTITGKITSIDGSEVSLQLGELSSSEQNQPMGTPPDQSSDSSSSDGTQQTPPEKPDDDSTDTDGTTSPSQGQQNSDGSQQTPPSMPSGGTNSNGQMPAPPDQSNGNSSDGSMPTPPDQSSNSDGTQQTPPSMPGNAQMGGGGFGQEFTATDGTATIDLTNTTVSTNDLEVGDVITVVFGDSNTISSVEVVNVSADAGNGGTPGGQTQSANVSYTANTTVDSDTAISDQTIASTGTDENAVLVENGANATITNATITRNSSDSTGGDNSSFYGVGAAVLNTDGTLKISDTTITTDAKGGAGVFSYGSGVTYVKDTTITTSQDTSGGIHVAGGGTLYAYDVTATTSGESSAAIRSDRGGGTIVADGGTYTSNGTGSPAIYSTADITVNDAALTSNSSEAICIEGKNTVRLYDCDLTGNMSDNSQNDCTWNVILYQSMSGDSEVGTSTFTMDGGTLTAKNGGMFYSTNTSSTFVLHNVDIAYADENDFFLKVTGNSNARGWGSSGSNGANTTFTGIDQDMEGDVIWDSISNLDLYLTEGSTLKGALVDDESNAGNGGDGTCDLYISSDSKWIVTGDSTLTNLYNAGTITDENGNTVTIKGTDGTVYVQGTSSYTITVSSYETSADLSGAGTIDAYSSYAVSAPVDF